jgi:3-oxoacyl-[acyl-carrier protein] reductase
MRLEGKVGIVTGASRGIGWATALAFAREGADVTVTARGRAELERLAGEIRQLGRRALVVAADLAVEAQVTAIAEKTLEEFGRVDILVNNAAVPGEHKVVEMPTEAWDYVLGVNLKAPFLLCRAVLPAMIAQRRGNIINVSSRAAKVGRMERSAYCAAKAGMNALTMALAKEVEEYGIRVNALLPGPVLTRMLGDDPEILKENPLPPEAIADPLVFLACEESRGMTGTSIDVYGAPWP